MSDIPAPYDGKNGLRTGAQALAELRAFRNIQKPHDYSVFRYRNAGKPACANDGEQPVKPAKRRKAVAE